MEYVHIDDKVTKSFYIMLISFSLIILTPLFIKSFL